MVQDVSARVDHPHQRVLIELTRSHHISGLAPSTTSRDTFRLALLLDPTHLTLSLSPCDGHCRVPFPNPIQHSYPCSAQKVFAHRDDAAPLLE